MPGHFGLSAVKDHLHITLAQLLAVGAIAQAYCAIIDDATRIVLL